MKLARLVGMVFAAVIALGAMAAATASASSPSFSTTKDTLSGVSGVGVLTAGSTIVECASDSNGGEINSADTVGKVVVTFSGCKATSTTGSGCTIKSVGAANSGEIVTHTLKGSLGTTKVGTDVGLVLEPETTKKFVTLAETPTPCKTPETTVTGAVAGEVSPLHSLQSTGKLLLALSGTSQAITSIQVLGKTVEPELEAFGLKATEATSDSLTFGGKVEVS